MLDETNTVDVLYCEESQPACSKSLITGAYGGIKVLIRESRANDTNDCLIAPNQICQSSISSDDFTCSLTDTCSSLELTGNKTLFDRSNTTQFTMRDDVRDGYSKDLCLKCEYKAKQYHKSFKVTQRPAFDPFDHITSDKN